MFPKVHVLNGSLYVAAPAAHLEVHRHQRRRRRGQGEIWFDGKTLTGCTDLHGPYRGPDGWIYWTKGAFAKQSTP